MKWTPPKCHSVQSDVLLQSRDSARPLLHLTLLQPQLRLREYGKLKPNTQLYFLSSSSLLMWRKSMELFEITWRRNWDRFFLYVYRYVRFQLFVMHTNPFLGCPSHMTYSWSVSWCFTWNKFLLNWVVYVLVFCSYFVVWHCFSRWILCFETELESFHG